MKKWQYTVFETIYTGDPMPAKDQLNNFGKNGWELVSSVLIGKLFDKEDAIILFTFKKPL
tara:strand:- start:223 stop:402 length:180 start_codon:yes stop_codon:yes gene_type:complete